CNVPETEEFEETDLVDGTFITLFETVNGRFGIVEGVVEDWKASKDQGDFTTEDPMQLHITFTPDDNEVIDQVTIDVKDPNATLYYSPDGGTTLIPFGVNPAVMTGAQFAAWTLYAKQSIVSDIDIPMTISMLIRDPDNGLTAIISQNTAAVIDAVADQPGNVLSSSVSTTGNL